MTGKRRKHYLTDESIIDCGEYGDATADETSLPSESEPIGRPPGSTSLSYEVIDAFIGYWLAHQTRLSQRTLIGLIRHVYKHLHGHTPAESTIRERIAALQETSRE
jgi:hypothetical protein